MKVQACCGDSVMGFTTVHAVIALPPLQLKHSSPDGEANGGLSPAKMPRVNKFLTSWPSMYWGRMWWKYFKVSVGLLGGLILSGPACFCSLLNAMCAGRKGLGR